MDIMARGVTDGEGDPRVTDGPIAASGGVDVGPVRKRRIDRHGGVGTAALVGVRLILAQVRQGIFGGFGAAGAVPSLAAGAAGGQPGDGAAGEEADDDRRQDNRIKRQRQRPREGPQGDGDGVTIGNSEGDGNQGHRQHDYPGDEFHGAVPSEIARDSPPAGGRDAIAATST